MLLLRTLRRDRWAAPGTVRRGLRVAAVAVRTHPRSFVYAVAGASLYAVMTVASAQVLGAVTDRVVLPALAAESVRGAALAAAAGAILLVGLLKAVGIVVRRTAASRVQFGAQAVLRRRLAAQYLRLPLSWHRQRSTGELLSIINSDVESAFAPMAPLPFAVGVLVLLVIAAAVLAATDPVLAVLGLLLIPAMTVVNRSYNVRSARPAMRAQERRARLAAVAHESVDGAEVVKTLGREAAETERFAAEARKVRDELIRLGRLRAGFNPLLDALPSLATLLVVLVGIVRVGSGAMTAGALVSAAYLFTLIAFPIRMIGYLLSEFPRSVAGWERMAPVLRARGDVGYGTDTLAGTGPVEIALEGVGFRHGEDDGGLTDVDLHVQPATTVAIVGPTGAGKSTIASLLVRLGDPQRGSVRLDGVDVAALERGAVPRAAALVFQSTYLFDDTVRHNITLGEPFSDDEVRAAARLAQADEFLSALPQGYDTPLGERGATLSGGQRQRLALARALVRRPRLLVLDDATSSVDPSIEAEILRGLRDAALPSTVVLVAYRRATIALADEVVFVAHGRVVARGPHEELLQRTPAYAQLIRAYDEPERMAT